MSLTNPRAIPANAYRAFGMSFSSNRALPFFAPAPGNSPLDFAFAAERRDEPSLPAGSTAEVRSSYDATVEAGTTRLHIRFAEIDRCDFDLDPAARTLSLQYGAARPSEIAAMLLGPAFSCMLRASGRLALHGCTLDIGGEAVAVLGESGAGKSTLSARFADRGFAILADDIVALSSENGHWRVEPGPPVMKLLPESFAGLRTPPPSRPLFRRQQKRRVLLGGHDGPAWRHQPDALPLSSLYILGQRVSGATAAVLQDVDRRQVPQILMAHRSLAFFEALNHMAARHEFGALVRLAADVPVRRLSPPDGLDLIDHTIDAIVQREAA
ncbi:MAG: hypothetical protein U1E18_01520 [Brevundimonas sp.]|uniref:hypothetical protein n=1 Tax=Brevundimonas sp. TaxID=1871086 RepID=UPI002AB96965|nr:hypothetical protein [Brevundimonas sp.]MDZ4108262.1 hypothetical protein [Brevundimonas sp.]